MDDDEGGEWGGGTLRQSGFWERKTRRRWKASTEAAIMNNEG